MDKNPIDFIANYWLDLLNNLVELIYGIDHTTVRMVFSVILIMLLAGFFIGFVIPAVIQWFRLVIIKSRLSRLETNASPDKYRSCFSMSKGLRHLWKEYEETLHRQYEQQDGQRILAKVRSTIPAETFFNSHTLVDARLRTEFFKHLPGIFTGLGIIGTFFGLISGLHAFHVSDDPVQVREGLSVLMKSVGSAFVISAIAIVAAMLVTLVEKLFLASLYRWADSIAQLIDERFEAGAGEEYLARLVESSEDSATQAKILKDALVKDLGDLLKDLSATQISASRELASSQIAASNEQNEALAQNIAKSIHDGLKEPMEELAGIVKSASGEHSATASRMLQDVMASFAQQLNELFGGQIAGINDLNQQASQRMSDAVDSLTSLVSSMEASSARSNDEMARRLAEAIERMESGQVTMNEHLKEVVAHILRTLDESQNKTVETLKNSVAGTIARIESGQQDIADQLKGVADHVRSSVMDAHSQTATALTATLGSLEEASSKLINDLRTTQHDALAKSEEREERMAERTENMLVEMVESVKEASKELGAASSSISDSVGALSKVTTETIGQMSTNAKSINDASRNFMNSIQAVGNVLDSAEVNVKELQQTSSRLAEASAVIQLLIRDYQSQRDSLTKVLEEVRQVTVEAKREASLTKDILDRMTISAQRMHEAREAADDYLEGVVDVLAKSQQAFNDQIGRTLDKSNHAFHDKLSTAVKLLSSSIEELESTLGTAGISRR